MKDRKSLTRNVMYTSSTHAGHVHVVEDFVKVVLPTCVFTTFKHRFLTHYTINRPKNFFDVVVCSFAVDRTHDTATAMKDVPERSTDHRITSTSLVFCS